MEFKEDIAKALHHLKKGNTIIYPTDTIWGLGCDATNPDAVDKIFKIKRRAEQKALVILVHSIAMMERYVQEVPEMAYQLIELSEKPLTLILPGAKLLAHNVVANDQSLAIRVCSDEFCQDLIRQFRRPIVSTSANFSSKRPPENFSDIDENFISLADYTVHYRQDDPRKSQASSIIKLGKGNEIKIIR